MDEIGDDGEEQQLRPVGRREQVVPELQPLAPSISQKDNGMHGWFCRDSSGVSCGGPGRTWSAPP